MTTNTFPNYTLHVLEARDVVWTSNLRKRPNMYVEITSAGLKTMRTRVVQESSTPTWNEIFPLSAKPSSVLSLALKRKKYLTADLCLGSFEIDVSALRTRCGNDENTVLELRKITDGTMACLLTVKLEANNAAQLAAVAAASARQDIEQSYIGAPISGYTAVQGAVVAIAASDIKDSIFAKSLGGIIAKINVIVEVVDKTAKLHPYANIAWQLASSLYKVIDRQLQRDMELCDLVSTMEDVYSFVNVTQDLPNKIQHLEDIITKIVAQTIECMIFVREYTDHGFSSRVMRQTISNTSQTISDLANVLRDLKKAFESGAVLQTAFVSTQTLEHVEKLVQNDTLKLLNPAHMDAFSRPECLPDTRLEILKFITEWLMTSSDQNVLWLYGVAGSGKSTISTTIAQYCHDIRRCGAFLFFNRNDPTNSDPAIVIRTLAHQLARFHPLIRDVISNRIEDRPEIVTAPIRTQFDSLLREPLNALPALHSQGPIIIVLDALDECGDATSRKTLLKVLSTELMRLPLVFRVLITSRDEFDIHISLTRPNVALKELDITNMAAAQDISAYFQYSLSELPLEAFQLPSDWPGDTIIQKLTQMAGGLFIWASTAVKFIEEGNRPQKSLDNLLCLSSYDDSQVRLDELYCTALRLAIKWDVDADAVYFCAVLGAIVVARIHLTDTLLCKILGCPADVVQVILSHLRCLLQWSPGQPIHILHTSFTDYLCNPEQCQQHPWFIQSMDHHHDFAIACFQIMKHNGLCFNICGIETSHLKNMEVPGISEKIDKAIPPQLAYASQYWMDHLELASNRHVILKEVEYLMHHQFLHWLEVLSLTNSVSLAGSALLKTAAWVKEEKHSSELVELLTDASKFVAAFEYPISQSAPHTYISALFFTPLESKVLQHIKGYYVNDFVKTGRPEQWSAVTKVIRGGSDDVRSVAYSPDGKYIVSGSADKTIQLWDAESGQAIREPFQGHSGWVQSVAFSPDSKHIVSCSTDKTIRLWDVMSGQAIGKPLQGHLGWVQSVAFSPDGKNIVSGSRDKTVQLWDIETSQAIGEPLTGHSDHVQSVVFSPDGKCIVSGSSDNTIQLWDVKSGKAIAEPLQGHSGYVWSVAFSPDGKKIASGSADKTVQLWDAKSGQAMGEPLKGHLGWVESVAFSPDGKHIASGSADKTIRLWDAKSGQAIGEPLQSHSGWVWSVAFSPNGKHFVSGSYYNTVELWDIESHQAIGKAFQGHSDWVQPVAFSLDNKQTTLASGDPTSQLWDPNLSPGIEEPIQNQSGGVWCVAFSPDGKHIVSGSTDYKIRLWDAKSGQAIGEPFQGHSDWVVSVAFSPDGKYIVSGSDDRTVQLWDMESGQAIGKPLQGHSEPVQSVSFSPNGKQVVSGSSDNTVRSWDVESGQVIGEPLQGHTDWVLSVAFSPDGKQIVSSSADKTVRLWDAKSGQAIGEPLQGHFGWVWSIAFSPDGKHIVSASDDGKIQLWDAKLCQAIREPFQGHSGPVQSVAFSPDGKYIVSGSHDNTIQLWDAKSGQAIGEPFQGHSDRILSVAFSPDNKYIVSGSGDHTIRVWDANSGQAARKPLQEPSEHESSIAFPPHILLHDESVEIINISSFVHGSVRYLDGWMITTDGKLLFWIPPAIQPGLLWPRNILVIGAKPIEIDYYKFAHGSKWTECQRSL